MQGEAGSHAVSTGFDGRHQKLIGIEIQKILYACIARQSRGLWLLLCPVTSKKREYPVWHATNEHLWLNSAILRFVYILKAAIVLLLGFLTANEAYLRSVHIRTQKEPLPS